MSLTIGILKETAHHEKRVAASVETVKKYGGFGAKILIEKDAGRSASILDEDYKNAGAKITTATEIAKHADIILCVQSPDEKTIKSLKKGTLLIGGLAPHDNKSLIELYAKTGLIACAMELIPRISRAQSMDILSSQSNLAGYKAVLDATEHFTRAFPMMMTAAGTVAPARVFVMGAGVAGLQAIATAKRLGAIVSATDVRPASKEQVESLGATFIAVEDDEFKEAETAGGYAKQMSAAYQKKQAQLIAETIAKQDVVITTALIPGRDAPILVTDPMIKSMKSGSVIVDLAVERGGNCTASKAGEIIKKNGVTIIGHRNVPSRLATDSSLLYAKNLFNFVSLLIDKETQKLKMDWEDEILQGVTLTKEGKVIHPMLKATPKKKNTPPKKKSTPKKTSKKTTTSTKKVKTS